MRESHTLTMSLLLIAGFKDRIHAVQPVTSEYLHTYKSDPTSSNRTNKYTQLTWIYQINKYIDVGALDCTRVCMFLCEKTQKCAQLRV